MNSETTSHAVERVAIGRLWWVGLFAATDAAIGNVIVFALGKSLLGISFLMPPKPGVTELVPLSMTNVVIASVVPAVAATVFLAILGKFAPRPIRVFRIISVVFLLVSFGGPLSLPVDLSTKVALSVMHVVAGAVIVGMLTVLGREK